MYDLFISILKMSFSASIVALVVMLARLCLRKSPKVFSYVLWLAVLLRLLCPFSLSVPVVEPSYTSFSLLAEDTLPTDQPLQHGNEALYLPDENNSVPPIATASNYEPTNQLSTKHGEKADTAQGVTEHETSIKIPYFLAYIWLTGILLMLCYFTWSYLSMSSKMNTAVRIANNIYESDRIASAFVLGLFKPRIYIPTRLVDEQKRNIILHEQTHIKRFDYLVKYIAFFILAVHWFNPVIWLSYTMMCGDMEKSCDEAVISRLAESGQPIRMIIKQYSLTLLSLAERNGLAAPVSFADNNVKERMKNIMRFANISTGKRKKNALFIIICILCTAALLIRHRKRHET